MLLGETVPPNKVKETEVWFKKTHWGIASVKMSLNQCQSMSSCVMETRNERRRESETIGFTLMKPELQQALSWRNGTHCTVSSLIPFRFDQLLSLLYDAVGVSVVEMQAEFFSSVPANKVLKPKSASVRRFSVAFYKRRLAGQSSWIITVLHCCRKNIKTKVI